MDGLTWIDRDLIWHKIDIDNNVSKYEWKGLTLKIEGDGDDQIHEQISRADVADRAIVRIALS